MEDQLVSIETALLARSKGFNIHCDNRYDETTNIAFNWKDDRVKQCIEYDRSYAYKAVECLSNSYYFEFNNDDIGYYISAPTQTLLERWLREVHNIRVAIDYKPNIKKWDFIVYSLNLNGLGYVKHYQKYRKEHPNRSFDTYEQAFESGLLEALNLI